MNRFLLAMLLSAGLALQFSGCSWTFTKRIPDGYHLSEPLHCSAYGLPVADFMNAGYSAVFALSPPKGLGDQTSEALGWVVLGAYSTVGLIFLISGLTGIFWSAQCHDTREAHQLWVKEEASRKVRQQAEPPEKGLPLPPGISPEEWSGKKEVEPEKKTEEVVPEVKKTKEIKKKKRFSKKHRKKLRKRRKKRKKRTTRTRRRKKAAKKKKKKKTKKKTRKKRREESS